VKSNREKLRVLHITSWYPNEKNQKEALWIQRHIQALSEHCHNEILHLGISVSDRWSFRKNASRYFNQILFEVRTRRWILIELVTLLFLLGYVIRLSVNKKFDIINFHIAYPLLANWGILKRFIKIPVVITEHWSAYHLNFNMQGGSKLKRIKNIFHQGLPLIIVSQSLKGDIEKFSGNDNVRSYVIPNVINSKVFYRHPSAITSFGTVFFSVSYWKYPKDPFVILQAFKLFHEQNVKSELRIGGFGPMYDEIRFEVERLALTNAVILLGQLDADRISQEMNKASAFLHSSGYETFSVVCAESLACGTPVIASSVGGIKELVSAENGILVPTNTMADWLSAMQQFQSGVFDREKISLDAIAKFSAENLGKKYYNILKELSGKSGKNA
jgi:L-malate glycosyltransferase